MRYKINASSNVSLLGLKKKKKNTPTKEQIGSKKAKKQIV